MKLKLLAAAILFSFTFSLKGQQLFTARYAFPKSSWLLSVTEIEADSSLLLTGSRLLSSNNTKPQLTIFKTSKIGVPIWEKEYSISAPFYTTGIEFTKQISPDSLVFLGNQSFVDSNGFTNLIPFIGKMDTAGNIAQIKGFRHSRFDILCKNIFETSDKGFIVCGSSSIYPNIPNSLKTQIFLMKLDHNLNQQWCKLYGDSENLYSGAFVMLPDGGLVITGMVAFSDTSNYAWYLMRTDSSGNINWAKYASNSNEIGSIKHHIILTNDSAIAVAYQSESPLLPGSDVSFAKIDLNGNLLWHRIQGDQYDDDVDGLVKMTDNGFMMLTPNLLRRFDSSGNVLFANFQNPGFSAGFSKMISIHDSGLVVIGLVNQPKTDMLISKTDNIGLSACFNSNFINIFSLQSSLILNSGFIMDSSINMNEVIDTLSKYDSLPTFQYVCFTTIEETPKIETLILFPNPIRQLLNIKSNNEINLIEIYSLSGILQFENRPKLSEVTFNLSKLQVGLYFVKVHTTSGLHVKKIIKID